MRAAGVGFPAMTAELSKNPETAAPPRRRPLWPWLLMPLATLAIYLALHTARQSTPPTTAPADTAEIPADR